MQSLNVLLVYAVVIGLNRYGSLGETHLVGVGVSTVYHPGHTIMSH